MQYEIRKVDELSHHGIQGQKWGIRRFQYKDGSLTDEGRKRYGSLKESISKWNIRRKEKSAERARQKEEAVEIEKQRLINHGTPKEIQKNITKFNSEELVKIQNRFSNEIRVRESIEKLTDSKKVLEKQPVNDKSAGKNKKSIDASISKGTKFLQENSDNMAKTIGNAKTFYNTVAVINNSLRKKADGTIGLRGPDLSSGRAADAGYMHLIR